MICDRHFWKFYSNGSQQVIAVTFCIYLFAGQVFSYNFFQQILNNAPMFALLSSDDYESQSKSVELLQFSSAITQKPMISISTSNCSPLRPYVNKNLISFVIITSEDVNEILQTVQIAYRGLHEARVIFLLLSDTSRELIEKIVNWCWTRRMINVLILTGKLSKRTVDYELYLFNPFPSLTIHQIPSNSPFEALFPEKIRDLRKFPIRTAQKYDHPRSFKYINDKGQEKIGGYLWKFISTWTSRYNGKLDIVDRNASDVFNRTQLMQYLQTGQIDVVPHFVLNGPTVNVTSSNGNFFARSLLIVPKSSPTPPGAYLVLPFHKEVWYAVVFATFYISFVQSICVFIAHGRFDLGEAFCNVVLGMSYQASNQKNFKYRSYLVVHGQLMFLGFILTNFYLALLSSFLTATVYNAQEDTYEDIDKSGIKIMIEDAAIDLWIGSKIPLKWKNVFYAVDRETYMENLRVLNPKYGYYLTSDKFLVIDFYQKPLKRPLFHVTSIAARGGWSGMTVRDDLVFLNSFNKFITMAFDVGLREKWMRDILLESIEAGIIKPNWIRADVFTPLTLPYLEILFIFLLCGYVAGFVSFGVECAIRRAKNK